MPRTLTFSVVCYGPARAGKMTCLRVIREAFPSDEPRGKVQTLWHARDFRWHDFEPPKLGLVDGFRLRLCVISYFCAGHDHPLCRRDVVLGTHGVIFVADSSEDRQKANVTSWRELHDNLQRAGLDPATLPIVIYYNKRDVARPAPVDAMNAALNPWGRHPWFAGSTHNPRAVAEALKGVTRGMIAAFRAERDARPATSRPPPPPPTGLSPMFGMRDSAPHERLRFARCAEIEPRGLRLLLLGDYTREPDPRPLAQRAPLRVDAKSLPKAMDDLGLTLSLTVPDMLSGAAGATLEVRLRIHRISDFSPDAVVRQVPRLAQELEVRRALTAVRGPISGEELTREIDGKLSRQVDEILHHPRFLALEASWRGLDLLVDSLPPSAPIRIDILPCSKEDLRADFEDAPPGTTNAGLAAIVARDDGYPYTAILADHEISADPADLFLLERCAAVAAAARAPFLAAAAPPLLGLDTYASLASVRDPGALLREAPYRQLRAWRETEAARDAALLLPRFLLRQRFGERALPADAFGYEEGRPDEPATYCWGNPIYAFAARLAASFAERGACDDIEGLDHGGAVQALPAQELARDERTVTIGPIEGVISPEGVTALVSEGLMPFAWVEDCDIACFPVAASLAKPRVP